MLQFFPFNLLPFSFGLAYALVMGAYAMVVGLVLAAALAILPFRRQAGLWLAGGIVGSLPFAVFFQCLCIPVIAIIYLLLPLWGAAIGLWLMFGAFIIASVTGCIAGWGVGERMALGMTGRNALRASSTLRLLAAGLNNLRRGAADVTPEHFVIKGFLAIMFIFGSIFTAHTLYVESFGDDEIEYRGEQIRLTRKYVDYDDYKNDPNNLSPSEISRVEKIMTDVRIGPSFANWKDFVGQFSKIKFPGYGGRGLPPKVATSGRRFIAEVIEIPRAAKDRYFVLEKVGSGESLRLVDDFVIPSSPIKRDGSTRGVVFWLLWLATGNSGLNDLRPAIASISLAGDQLVYTDHDAKVVRETRVPEY